MDIKNTERINTITRILKETYPTAHIALTYKTPWELLVAVILSAQCTDITVNKVTPHLFSQFPTIVSFANAQQELLEQAIRSTGFFRNKTKNIIQTAKKIIAEYGGMVPNTIETLITLPGVARKTANVVLTNAFHTTVGIAVDTHVQRLSQRLRLIDMPSIGGGHHPMYVPATAPPMVDYYTDADPVKIERQLMQTFPQKIWKSLSYQLIDHGRACCTAKKPSCYDCPLAAYCPTKRNP